MTADEKAAPIPAEVEKLELWFFRDLTEEQRMKLFALFGAPVAEIRAQSHEQLVFRHIMKALTADRASQEERIREDEPGFVQLPDGWLAVEMKAVEREFATWPKGLRSSFEALLRDAERARLRGDAS